MTVFLGLVRSPGMRFHGAPCSTNRSTGFTDAAQSLIKTSLPLGLGVGTSANRNSSGDPYCVRTIAFIECSLKGLRSRRPCVWCTRRTYESIGRTRQLAPDKALPVLTHPH